MKFLKILVLFLFLKYNFQKKKKNKILKIYIKNLIIYILLFYYIIVKILSDKINEKIIKIWIYILKDIFSVENIYIL